MKALLRKNPGGFPPQTASSAFDAAAGDLVGSAEHEELASVGIARELRRFVEKVDEFARPAALAAVRAIDNAAQFAQADKHGRNLARAASPHEPFAWKTMISLVERAGPGEPAAHGQDSHFAATEVIAHRWLRA